MPFSFSYSVLQYTKSRLHRVITFLFICSFIFCWIHADPDPNPQQCLNSKVRMMFQRPFNFFLPHQPELGTLAVGLLYFGLQLVHLGPGLLQQPEVPLNLRQLGRRDLTHPLQRVLLILHMLDTARVRSCSVSSSIDSPSLLAPGGDFGQCYGAGIISSLTMFLVSAPLRLYVSTVTDTLPDLRD